MKHSRLVICLSLVAFFAHSSLVSADPDKSIRILTAKSDDSTLKIAIGSETYLAPVRFEDSSFSWNDVKDSYTVTPAFAAYIRQGRVSVYIGCSGASFQLIKRTDKPGKGK